METEIVGVQYGYLRGVDLFSYHNECGYICTGMIGEFTRFGLSVMDVSKFLYRNGITKEFKENFNIWKWR